MKEQLMNRFGDPKAEIYPMPSFVRLGVSDLERASTWYKEVLGFSSIFEMPGPNGQLTISHLRWAKYADLMLVPRSDTSKAYQANPDLSIYFTVDRGTTESIAARAGEAVLEGPILRPWNARELVVQDPDGNRITFAEQGDPSLSFDSVMDRVSKQS